MIVSIEALVRRIFLILDDDEFSRLLAKKGQQTWKEFLIDSHLSEATGDKPKRPSKTTVKVDGGEMGEEVAKVLKVRFGEKVRVQVQSS